MDEIKGILALKHQHFQPDLWMLAEQQWKNFEEKQVCFTDAVNKKIFLSPRFLHLHKT